MTFHLVSLPLTYDDLEGSNLDTLESNFENAIPLTLLDGILSYWVTIVPWAV